ncbi:hypothetical protein IBT50_27045, partial [Bacillus sp. S70]|uniref:hypothetical protein n=1 Tax=Bacillus sp. S70 TaxID=1226988 RepID=UPI00190A6170
LDIDRKVAETLRSEAFPTEHFGAPLGGLLLSLDGMSGWQRLIKVELPLAALFQTESLQAYAELAAAQTS